MCAIEKAYEIFGALMTEEKLYLNPSIKFKTLCSKLGVDPAEMDRKLFNELGYKGEELMEAYREGTRRALQEKYGLVFVF